MNHCVQLVKQMDWNNLRAFLAVVRGGTLRVAAERTDLSAATVSRRLDELEIVVGEKLIERMPTGCVPTVAGQRVAAWAEQMEEIAAQIERTKELEGVGPEGTVRINADEWMSYFLTARIAPLKQRFPGLAVEILTSHRPYSLARREADISLRPFRPSRGDLVGRRVGQVYFGLYGASEYVHAHHDAIAKERWGGLAFVSFDDLRSAFAADSWLRGLPDVPNPWLRCSYALGIFDGVSAGAGLGVLASFLARHSPNLIAVKPVIPELTQDVWLTYHSAVRGSARVKAVTDFIVELFETEASA